jgi:hypothetical protein
MIGLAVYCNKWFNNGLIKGAVTIVSLLMAKLAALPLVFLFSFKDQET